MAHVLPDICLHNMSPDTDVSAGKHASVFPVPGTLYLSISLGNGPDTVCVCVCIPKRAIRGSVTGLNLTLSLSVCEGNMSFQRK